MYILVELEELREFAELYASRVDPDIPLEATLDNKKTLESITELLDMIIDSEEEIVKENIADQEMIEAAHCVLKRLFTRMILRENIQWIRVIDRFGGLVIRIKPGAIVNGQPNLSGYR